MYNWNLRQGVVLIDIHGVSLLASDKDARKHCGFVRRVNELGARIWQLMAEGKTREEIKSSIQKEYQLPEHYDLEEDLDQFICSLRNHQYIINEDNKNEV